MKKSRFIRLGISTILCTLIIGCGSSGSSEEPVVLNANIQKIVDWAKGTGTGTGTAPTEADYTAAGVDLHGKNVNDINAYIRQLNSASAVDTVEEIEEIAQELGVTILDSDGDGTYDAFDSTPNGDNSSPNVGASISKLHVEDASDLYGYTINAGKNSTVVTYTINCSGSFTSDLSVNGTVYPYLSYQGDTINVVSGSNSKNIGVHFIGVRSTGDEADSVFLFKNEDSNIVVGQTNYDGVVDFFVSSIVKKSTCN